MEWKSRFGAPAPNVPSTEVGDQRQKPSIHTLPDAHALPIVGSHSPPRFWADPHTAWVPLDVVTVLHIAKVYSAAHAVSLGASQET